MPRELPNNDCPFAAWETLLCDKSFLQPDMTFNVQGSPDVVRLPTELRMPYRTREHRDVSLDVLVFCLPSESPWRLGMVF